MFTKKQILLMKTKVIIIVIAGIVFFVPVIPADVPVTCVTSPCDTIIEHKTIIGYIRHIVSDTVIGDAYGTPPSPPYQFTYTLVDEQSNPIQPRPKVGHFVSFSISEFRDGKHSATYEPEIFGGGEPTVPTGIVNVGWNQVNEDLVVSVIAKVFITDRSECPDKIFETINGQEVLINFQEIQDCPSKETLLQSEKFVFDVPEVIIQIFPFTYFEHTFVMKEQFIPLPEIVIPILETPTGINSLYYIIGGAVVVCIVIMVLLLRNRK